MSRPRIIVYLDPEEKRAVEALADKKRARSVSSMVRDLLLDRLESENINPDDYARNGAPQA